MTLDVKKPADGAGLTIEAWAQGYMVGSLIIMACLAVANMRRHVLLHKLIVVEVRILCTRLTHCYTRLEDSLDF